MSKKLRKVETKIDEPEDEPQDVSGENWDKPWQYWRNLLNNKSIAAAILLMDTEMTFDDLVEAPITLQNGDQLCRIEPLEVDRRDCWNAVKAVMDYQWKLCQIPNEYFA